MEIVDEKGKFLGIVNAVDLLIIAIVVMIGLFTYYTVFGTEDWTYIQIRAEDQPTLVIENLAVGDAEHGNISGRKIGEIVAVDVMPSVSSSSDVIVTMKLLAKQVFGDIIYKESKLKINSQIEIETENVMFQGKVIAISDSEIEGYQSSIERKILFLEADNISYKLTGQVRDGKIKTLGGAIVEITDYELVPVTQTRYNIILKADVPLEKRGGKYYFGSELANIGSQVFIPLDSTFLKAEVLEIQNSEEKNRAIERNTVELVLLIDAGNISTEYLENISEGDTEMGFDGQVIAELVGVRKEYNSEYSRRVYLTVKVRAEQKAGYLFYKGSLIKSGSSITISTTNTAISGTIESINSIFSAENAYPRTDISKKVIAVAENIYPWIEDKFAEGDKEIDPETEEVIAEILSETVENAEIIVTTEEGNILKKSHPRNKDVKMNLILRMEEDKQGRLYFKGNWVKVNSRILLEMNGVNFWARIHEINGINDLNG